MAIRYFGVAREESNATTGNSTTSKEIELAVTSDASPEITKKQILLGLDKIRRAVLDDDGFSEI